MNPYNNSPPVQLQRKKKPCIRAVANNNNNSNTIFSSGISQPSESQESLLKIELYLHTNQNVNCQPVGDKNSCNKNNNNHNNHNNNNNNSYFKLFIQT